MSKVIPLFTTEYELAAALAKGDPQAQTTLYNTYGAKMLGVCSRYLTDSMEAEDVMIEGFMKIFDKVNQFGFQGSFEGWMRRIMVNESLMALRSKKSLHIPIEDATAADTNLRIEENTQLETADLLQLIQELPAGYRAVFNLYAIEGYSHAEIAAMLGITEGTSKSQLSRARSILQERILKTSRQTNYS